VTFKLSPLTMISNQSVNNDTCQPQSINHFVPIFLSFVFLGGFIINCISLWIFWFRIKHWNAGMVLQFNLALTDSIITPAAPLIIIYSMVDDWTFGEFPCQLKVFLLSTHMYGSIYFLTLISVHRYITIVHSTKRTIFTRKTVMKKVSIAVWICLLLQGIPFFFVLKTTKINSDTKCLSFHQTDMAVLYFVWNWIIFFTGMLIPFGVCLTCYGLLSTYISKMNTCNTKSKEAKVKSLQTIAMSLLIFIICYVPVHVTRTMGVTIKLLFPANCALLERVEVVYYITWMISGVNCCLDPILYCFASDKFSDTFRKSFLGFRCCQKQNNISGRAGEVNAQGLASREEP
uniref:G-protein coupled receptors family 1 profile domain-containing protein n=1 Tax=Latimeria chalumnae TaxID=7897 RepID=H3BA74_LATCH